jgi:hypothetical protein
MIPKNLIPLPSKISDGKNKSIDSCSFPAHPDFGEGSFSFKPIHEKDVVRGHFGSCSRSLSLLQFSNGMVYNVNENQTPLSIPLPRAEIIPDVDKGLGTYFGNISNTFSLNRKWYRVFFLNPGIEFVLSFVRNKWGCNVLTPRRACMSKEELDWFAAIGKSDFEVETSICNFIKGYSPINKLKNFIEKRAEEGVHFHITCNISSNNFKDLFSNPLENIRILGVVSFQAAKREAVLASQDFVISASKASGILCPSQSMAKFNFSSIQGLANRANKKAIICDSSTNSRLYEIYPRNYSKIKTTFSIMETKQDVFNFDALYLFDKWTASKEGLKDFLNKNASLVERGAFSSEEKDELINKLQAFKNSALKYLNMRKCLLSYCKILSSLHCKGTVLKQNYNKIVESAKTDNLQQKYFIALWDLLEVLDKKASLQAEKNMFKIFNDFQ